MNPISVATFSDVIANLVTKDVIEQSAERLADGYELDGCMDLVVIKLAEYIETKKYNIAKYNIEEFLRRKSRQSKVLGLIGMHPIAQALAVQASAEFGIEVIYHDSHPAPEVEKSCAARFLSIDHVLRRADFIVIVLPLTGAVEKLLGENQFKALQAHEIFLAWQRLPSIERAIVHLSKHYAKPIYLEDLAAIAGLSKFHFVRLFSATLGVTPHRCQLLMRMSHAKALLRGGETIVEVAFRVGFCDQSHFSRYFRLLVGMTPGQYQKAAAA